MIINFNKALKNSFTTKVFSKFLQLKTPKDEYDLDTSNNLVNDLQFLVIDAFYRTFFSFFWY